MKRLLVCTLGLACLNSWTVLAKDSGAPTRYQWTLGAVPAAELPAKAAELVKQAKARDWAKTTAGVTKAAVTINPAAAPSIVGAIARAVPDMAAVAAGTAAAEKPKLAAAIAKAAAGVAPSKAGEIVVAICRAAPTEYRSVAVVVSQTVPGSAKTVLKAVASAIPELKSGVEKALADYRGNSFSVAAVLDQVNGSQTTTGPANGPVARGPTVEPPFIPFSSTVKTIDPGISGEVPTGGRDYGKP